MTSRTDIEKTVRSVYAARVSGDLDGVMTGIADNSRFALNGRGTGVPALAAASKGKADIRKMMKELIDTWRFDEWKELSLLVDGEKACLHWRARITCVPTGKSEDFEVLDIITFRDGKIVDFHQATDTAMVMKLATP
jgi:ketosteroid isomerase-like protein